MKSFFSNNIKSLRIDNDYSQQEIATILGISRSRYSNYENGIHEPPLNILIELSNIYNCSIDDLLKIKIDTLLIKKPNLSVSFNEFTYQNLIDTLYKHKQFYKNKKLTILDEIDNKIKEIDDLISLLNLKQKTNSSIINHYDSEIADEISPNVIDFNKVKKKKKVNYRDINYSGKVSAGSPRISFEVILDTFKINSDLLCDSKEYFILKIAGDSMNKLFDYDDYILVEKTSYVANDDLVIAFINDESTCKKILFDNDEIHLIPLSTNPKHKIQVYNLDEVYICGKVLGKLSDYIEKDE